MQFGNNDDDDDDDFDDDGACIEIFIFRGINRF